jgi:hemolysin activation/secretion protein
VIHWFIRPSERRACAYLALYTLFSGAAMAQTRPDAGTILDSVREPRAPTRPGTGLQLPPEPRPALKPTPSLKVQVKGFRISGNTLFTEAEIQPILAEFLSKELDFEGLSEAARSVTSFYRGKGYFLAQAYLPKQELGSGIVEIFVLEGRIGKVEVKPKAGARLRPFIAEGYMRRVDQGEIAREADVERPLLLLQDLPATTVQSTLGPGSKVGEADLTVEYGDDGRRVTGVAEVENFGNKFAGTIRFGGQVFINNPTGFGDLLTLRGLVSQDALTQVLGVSYALPVGYWGTKVGVSLSQLRYKLGGSLAPSQASGEGDLASLLVVHPLVRGRDFNLFGQVSADVKELEDRVDAVANLEQRRIKTWKLGVFGDSRDFLGSGGLNTFGFTVTSGDLRLLNPILVTNDSIAFNTAGSFTKFNAEFQRVQRVTDALHGVARASYQTASKNLASAEKISVGGPFGVRAYPVGEGLADEATQLTLEARYTLPGFKLMQSDVTLAGFVDGAHVRRWRNQNQAFDVDPTTFAPLANQRTFWGAGFGVRVGKEGNYALVADLAWRLGDEQPTSDVPRHPRLWVRGVKWF